MIDDKAPERIWLQKHKDEPEINPTWTAEPCPLDRGDGQFEYIRADLVDVPGRCGGCEYWADLHHGFGKCEQDSADNAKNWPPTGFCHEFKPKGGDDGTR